MLETRGGPSDPFLSISEIARRIGMDRKTVVAMGKSGKIPIREFSPRNKGMFESHLRGWIEGGDSWRH